MSTHQSNFMIEEDSFFLCLLPLQTYDDYRRAVAKFGISLTAPTRGTSKCSRIENSKPTLRNQRTKIAEWIAMHLVALSLSLSFSFCLSLSLSIARLFARSLIRSLSLSLSLFLSLSLSIYIALFLSLSLSLSISLS
jgi:hypothetical protein